MVTPELIANLPTREKLNVYLDIMYPGINGKIPAATKAKYTKADFSDIVELQMDEEEMPNTSRHLLLWNYNG